jgi:hypothetical protein
MPVSDGRAPGLQMITFVVETMKGDAPPFWITVHAGDTVQRIAANHGHPELARTIAKLNGIRSVKRVLRHHPKRKGDLHRVKLPGRMKKSWGFSVLAGSSPPSVVSGYAKLTTTDRPRRTGISTFVGYDPIVMEIPIMLSTVSGETAAGIETICGRLEAMAGRGDFEGAARGAPPVLRISTTDANGAVVPLIPHNYQWADDNANAPLWRVGSSNGGNPIQWGTQPGTEVMRNRDGQRRLQTATVTVEQYTSVQLASRSVTTRKKK